jgi:hypothetical protein
VERGHGTQAVPGQGPAGRVGRDRVTHGWGSAPGMLSTDAGASGLPYVQPGGSRSRHDGSGIPAAVTAAQRFSPGGWPRSGRSRTGHSW